MAARVVNRSTASVLASRASTPSKADDAIIKAASAAPRRLTKARAHQ